LTGLLMVIAEDSTSFSNVGDGWEDAIGR
jgi:hypothetical protein